MSSIQLILLVIFIALCIFYWFKAKSRQAKQRRRERFTEKQEALLNIIRKRENKEQ